MAIGPVQLLVLGFNHPDFHGEIIAELERLREHDMVRVIDSLVVYKSADGALEVEGPHLPLLRLIDARRWSPDFQHDADLDRDDDRAVPPDATASPDDDQQPEESR